MNEEIKEIVDYLKDEDEYYDGKEKVVLSYDEKVIERDDISLLLNYITNLQQENKRLKEELNYTISQVQHNQIVTKLCKEKENYKSRCKKTINSIDILQEIIYQQPTENGADDMWLLDKLDGFKNILNGSDEK